MMRPILLLLSLFLTLSVQTSAQPTLRPVASAASDSLPDARREQQAHELRQLLPGAQVVRQGQSIRLTLAATLLFEDKQAHLRQPQGIAALDSLTEIVKRYPHTTVVVASYAAAAQGTTPPNYRLAQQRAYTVRSLAMMHGVVPERIRVQRHDTTAADSLADQLEITISTRVQPEPTDSAGVR